MAYDAKSIRIAAHIGGTFTDVVLIDTAGEIWTHKLPSTPPDFERAVLAGIGHLLEAAAAVACRDYEYGFSTKRAHTHASMVE